MRIIAVDGILWRATAVTFLSLPAEGGESHWCAGLLFLSDGGERRLHRMREAPTRAHLNAMDVQKLQQMIRNSPPA